MTCPGWTEYKSLLLSGHGQCRLQVAVRTRMACSLVYGERLSFHTFDKSGHVQDFGSPKMMAPSNHNCRLIGHPPTPDAEIGSDW
jgi:hypothetical protein